MGQYFIICNFDKREFLTPAWFGQFNKLGDIARPADGMMVGLASLLALSGTDLYHGGPFYGRWVGDRIAFLGDDYQGVVAGHEIGVDTFYEITYQENGWVDISEHLRSFLEAHWEDLRFAPPRATGMTPRSMLRADGTIVAVHSPSPGNDPGHDDEAEGH